MRLTEEELETGRNYVRVGQLAGLESWSDERHIMVSKVVLHDTMVRTMKRDLVLAMKLYDKVFVGMVPELDRRVVKIKLAFIATVVLVVGLGCLGGAVYLLRVIF